MSDLLLIPTQFLAFGLGAWVVVQTILSAVRTFVLPRSAPDLIVRVVFRNVLWLFSLRVRRLQTYEQKDQVLALYAPLALLSLPPTWLLLICLGYAGMFWGVGVSDGYQAFLESGSSLFTLGFVPATANAAQAMLSFSEAGLGMIMVALLISYLPTMYSAFSRRETLVNLFETRAGSPPSGVKMFEITSTIATQGMERNFSDLWTQWEVWFSELDETHTSLPALAFFRSPQPHHSWITAAGAVMDAAALYLSVFDAPRLPQAALCIRAGYLALRHICDFFSIPYPLDPHFPKDPISVSRIEFDEACAYLGHLGWKLKPDRDQAWTDFAGWRVNYDRTLIALCTLTSAPPAPWSSDRMWALKIKPDLLFNHAKALKILKKQGHDELRLGE